MDTSHNNLPSPTKSQRIAYLLLVIVILGIGLYILAQGISQLLSL